jgi:hypothetical protein
VSSPPARRRGDASRIPRAWRAGRAGQPLLETRVIARSSPLATSSSNNSRGRLASARAISTRRRSP